MELLNSKVDHPDYQCDHTDWGIALCEKLDSPRFKLLYDIYHMQVMEGDVVATIKKAAPYIGHYHTAGVPGRHEIDESQELYYPAIIKAIGATGYDGFVAQEFIPTWDDQRAALADAIARCSG
jgi:hydroxypyruvate isomerase